MTHLFAADLFTILEKLASKALISTMVNLKTIILGGFPTHPAVSSKVIWFGPTLKRPIPRTGPAFGNVSFYLDVSLLDALISDDDFSIYWIENLEFGTIVAPRYI